MEHRISFKVYYEDTDSLGVVYYANYLKYLERARTEMIDAGGKPIRQWNEEGWNFAVYKLEITFLKPARLGDLGEVITTAIGGTEYRRKLRQVIEVRGEVITEAVVHLVCLDAALKLREFPAGALGEVDA